MWRVVCRPQVRVFGAGPLGCLGNPVYHNKSKCMFVSVSKMAAPWALPRQGSQNRSLSKTGRGGHQRADVVFFPPFLPSFPLINPELKKLQAIQLPIPGLSTCIISNNSFSTVAVPSRPSTERRAAAWHPGESGSTSSAPTTPLAPAPKAVHVTPPIG